MKNQAKYNPCHICGSQEFIWGRSVGNSHDWIYFRKDGSLWGGGERLNALNARKCNNVQFFADVE